MQTAIHRIAAMRITLGLAMQAKLETPDLSALRLAVNAVDREFPEGDQLRAAVHDFADRFPCVRRNPPELRAAGEVLFSAVRRATWSSASSRADLDE